jgi:mannose-6-phosphate isomerase
MIRQTGTELPVQLLPLFRERVWGRNSLAPFFPENPDGKCIGEIWFTCEENPTSTGQFLGELIRENPGILGTALDSRHPTICPLLIKLIFTSERLSVQVHPDDEYAGKHHGCLGKTEAWYVMDSQPPGEVAVGFREPLTREKFRLAVASGEVEHLLDWRKVRQGDVIFTPAGTVHAIGAGLTICEIQENSDITYRLYDYGRPRELHLDHGIAVSKLAPHDCHTASKQLAEWRVALMDCEYFRMERLDLDRPLRIGRGQDYFLLLICLEGSGSIASQKFQAGTAWMVPAGNREFTIDGAKSQWMLTYLSDSLAANIHCD